MFPKRLAIVVALASSACSLQRLVLKSAFEGTADFTASPGFEGTSLDQVGEGVYSFRWGWYRNLAVDTSEGWVVTDPFNAAAAREMRKDLEAVRPGKPVHTLIYSHYHVDHISGGEALQAKNIIAHENCPARWTDLGATGIAPPTELINGDQTRTIGGVEFRLLYLGRSHGEETLYALFVPQKRVLWTADIGFVKAFPSQGIPDSYWPGVFAALDRFSALDFDVFVPSHFGYGTKQDLLDFVTMMKFVRQSSHEQLARYGGRFPSDKAQLGELFAATYDPLRERYGDWHGFDQMAFLLLVRSMTGDVLGF